MGVIRFQCKALSSHPESPHPESPQSLVRPRLYRTDPRSLSQTDPGLPHTYTPVSSRSKVMERNARPTFAICGTLSGATESATK